MRRLPLLAAIWWPVRKAFGIVLRRPRAREGAGAEGAPSLVRRRGPDFPAVPAAGAELSTCPSPPSAPSPPPAGSVLGINGNSEAVASRLGGEPAFKKRVQERGRWARGGSGCKRLQRN